MIPPGRDPRLVQREIELERTRKKLLDQRLNWKIEEIKNNPEVEKILVSTVHEDLTLSRMYINKERIISYSKEIDSVEEAYKSEIEKYKALESLKSKLSNSIRLFWRNQKRFLEFIDTKNPWKISEINSIVGYIGHYSWVLSGEKNFKDREGNPFFGKYEEYQEKFRNMLLGDVLDFRIENWANYNNLCVRMHEIAPKYNSIDSILISI